jgi:hypothetical protein
MSIQISTRSAPPTNSYRWVSSLPTRSVDTDFYFKGIISATCFRSQLPQFYLTSNTKSYKMMCGILYVFASCVILLIRKTLKDFMKIVGHSLIHGNLFTLTSLPIYPDSLLSSEKPFSTPGDKIIFFVLRLSAGCSTVDCSHRQLTE